MPAKRNWFLELVDGFFDLISTGKPKVDAFIKGMAVTAVLMSVVIASASYIGGTVTDVYKGGAQHIGAMMKGNDGGTVTVVVKAAGDALDVVTDTATELVDDAVELISPSEVTASAGIASGSDVPVVD